MTSIRAQAAYSHILDTLHGHISFLSDQGIIKEDSLKIILSELCKLDFHSVQSSASLRRVQEPTRTTIDRELPALDQSRSTASVPSPVIPLASPAPDGLTPVPDLLHESKTPSSNNVQHHPKHPNHPNIRRQTTLSVDDSPYAPSQPLRDNVNVDEQNDKQEYKLDSQNQVRLQQEQLPDQDLTTGELESLVAASISDDHDGSEMIVLEGADDEDEDEDDYTESLKDLSVEPGMIHSSQKPELPPLLFSSYTTLPSTFDVTSTSEPSTDKDAESMVSHGLTAASDPVVTPATLSNFDASSSALAQPTSSPMENETPPPAQTLAQDIHPEHTRESPITLDQPASVATAPVVNIASPTLPTTLGGALSNQPTIYSPAVQPNPVVFDPNQHQQFQHSPQPRDESPQVYQPPVSAPHQHHTSSSLPLSTGNEEQMSITGIIQEMEGPGYRAELPKSSEKGLSFSKHIHETTTSTFASMDGVDSMTSVDTAKNSEPKPPTPPPKDDSPAPVASQPPGPIVDTVLPFNPFEPPKLSNPAQNYQMYQPKPYQPKSSYTPSVRKPPSSQTKDIPSIHTPQSTLPLQPLEGSQAPIGTQEQTAPIQQQTPVSADGPHPNQPLQLTQQPLQLTQQQQYQVQQQYQQQQQQEQQRQQLYFQHQQPQQQQQLQQQHQQHQHQQQHQLQQQSPFIPEMSDPNSVPVSAASSTSESSSKNPGKKWMSALRSSFIPKDIKKDSKDHKDKDHDRKAHDQHAQHGIQHPPVHEEHLGAGHMNMQQHPMGPNQFAHGPYNTALQQQQMQHLQQNQQFQQQPSQQFPAGSNPAQQRESFIGMSAGTGVTPVSLQTQHPVSYAPVSGQGQPDPVHVQQQQPQPTYPTQQVPPMQQQQQQQQFAQAQQQQLPFPLQQQNPPPQQPPSSQDTPTLIEPMDGQQKSLPHNDMRLSFNAESLLPDPKESGSAASAAAAAIKAARISTSSSSLPLHQGNDGSAVEQIAQNPYQQQQQQQGQQQQQQQPIVQTVPQQQAIPGSPLSDAGSRLSTFSSDSDIRNFQVIARAQAMFDFAGEDEGDLAFRVGDIINVIAYLNDDWWRGALRKDVGIFPTAYVQKL
ncbi:ESCRT-0 subunit protein hse1, partial [Podila humilis]